MFLSVVDGEHCVRAWCSRQFVLVMRSTELPVKFLALSAPLPGVFQAPRAYPTML
jgi:hypothetical protein